MIQWQGEPTSSPDGARPPGLEVRALPQSSLRMVGPAVAFLHGLPGCRDRRPCVVVGDRDRRAGRSQGGAGRPVDRDGDCSVVSKVVSALTITGIVLVVWPGVNVTVPLAAV